MPMHIILGVVVVVVVVVPGAFIVFPILPDSIPLSPPRATRRGFAFCSPTTFKRRKRPSEKDPNAACSACSACSGGRERTPRRAGLCRARVFFGGGSGGGARPG